MSNLTRAKEPLTLAVDQGTSSTKAVIFTREGRAVASASALLDTKFGGGGQVEQDPEEIYRSVLSASSQALSLLEQGNPGSKKRITGLGISNQRETFVLWDKTGSPVCPAVVWQDKRSVELCTELQARGLNDLIREKTGLRIDPYFSGTKLSRLFHQNDSVRQVYERGELHFGTVDSWLLYRLTGGKEYAVDHTNASRTLLFNIHTLDWDRELLELFRVPRILLPRVKPSAAFYGETDLEGLLGHTAAVTAMAGDSHAALFGEGCFNRGDAKATLGTGCSVMINSGDQIISGSSGGGLATVGFSHGNRICYALEGVIVSAGSILTWLQREWGFFDDPRELDGLNDKRGKGDPVYLIPGHAGLGAPFWQMDAAGSLHGIRLNTGREEVMLAALDSIVFQIKAVIEGLTKGGQLSCSSLNIDGGISRNPLIRRNLADLLNIPVRQHSHAHISALGAAMLASLGAGHTSISTLAAGVNSERKDTLPGDPEPALDQKYRSWYELAERG